MRLEVQDAFSFRAGERLSFRVFDEDVDRYAVMLVDVNLPSPQKSRTSDGPVMSLGVFAAQRFGGGWQWMQLAPSTKEAVAAHAADVCKLESGKWYGMVVEADSNSEDDGA